MTDGFVLGYNNELGRVLIATKDFQIGDIVIKEKPLVVYNSMIELIHKVNQLSSTEKELLYDMHHRDFKINPPQFEECRRFMNESLDICKTEELFKFLKNNGMSIDDVSRILHISNFNAHNFVGSNSTYIEDSSSSNSENTRTALFYLGSKVAHSCDPNCAYTSKVCDDDDIDNTYDVLLYTAIKPIKVGDIISFSYINPRLSTEDRRALLMREKDFFCECSKCAGYDHNRGLACNVNGCKGYKYYKKTNFLSQFSWKCCVCGDDGDLPLDCLQREYDLMITFQTIVESSKILEKGIEQLSELLKKANSHLAPTHYLIPNIYLEFSKIHASIANRLKYHEIALKSRLDAVVAHLKVFSLLECADSNCSKGLNCNENHQPVQYVTSYALWSFMDLINVIKSQNIQFIENIPFYLERLQRYIPYLIIEYGKKDPDVISVIALYDNHYENTLATLVKCRNKFCFDKGKARCSKCLNPNIVYCSKSCQTKSWKYHKSYECI